MTTFEHEGKNYELKMTRAGVRVAEAQGLSSSQIAEKPFSALALLFFASLYSRCSPNCRRRMLTFSAWASRSRFRLAGRGYAVHIARRLLR
jgi:hypothetical protein